MTGRVELRSDLVNSTGPVYKEVNVKSLGKHFFYISKCVDFKMIHTCSLLGAFAHPGNQQK